MQQRYGRALRMYYPHADDLEEWVGKNGINGFRSGPDQRHGCCSIRKVAPFGVRSRGAAPGSPAFAAASQRAVRWRLRWNGTANTGCTR